MVQNSNLIQKPPLPCVAVVETNPTVRTHILQLLSQHDITCWEANTIAEFQSHNHSVNADIVVMGVSAPAVDHIATISELRQNMPIGLVAVPNEQSHEAGKLCLQAGADHYLLKPIDDELLVIMIQALWRRLSIHAAAATPAPAAALSRWVLDEVNSCLIIDQNTAVNLSHQEIAFLAAVMQKPNAPIPMANLHHVMFPDYEDVNSHRLSVLLNRLRKKVKGKGFRLPIRSLYGRGLVYIQN